MPQDSISTFFDRIRTIMSYFEIGSINELATKYLNYKSSQKLNRLKDGENEPSIDIVKDILRTWPSINAKWLLLGEGEMLCGVEKEAGSSNIIEEPADVVTNLKLVRKDLKTVLDHQVRARAEIRGYGEYQVMKDARGSDQRRIEIMAQISKLIDANLEDGEIVDTAP